MEEKITLCGDNCMEGAKEHNVQKCNQWDEYASVMDIYAVYRDLAEKITDAKKYLFHEGGHPAMITYAEEFSILTKRFFSNMTH